MAQSKNMARLTEDMKREIIAIIGEMKDPRVQGFLTVMRLEVAPDCSSAKVYLSVLGKENATAEAVDALNRAAGHVRSEIAKRMHIRKSPEFRFIGDDGAAYASHINAMLADLEKKEK
ncbi:MAG: 30S ribosome-binding factor RbfA [Ruthenibacterium sp.]